MKDFLAWLGGVGIAVAVGLFVAGAVLIGSGENSDLGVNLLAYGGLALVVGMVIGFVSSKL